MPTADYGIVGSYNNQRVTSIDGERSVNLFEYIDPLAKKPKILIPTSGLDGSEVDFGATTGGFRQSFFFNDVTYHVIGQDVWKISLVGSILTPVKLNSMPLATATGYVGIDANTFQVIFVDGQDGYIYDTMAGTFLQITDTSFPPNPVDVCYLDGFFIVAQGNTNNFQLSSYNQGMVWGPASNQVTTTIGTPGLEDQLIIGISNLGGVATSQNFATGIPITLTIGAGGSLVGSGLAISTTYYSILVDSTHIKLATSYANAIAGTAINITADITPIINLVSDGQLQQAQITTHPGNIVACRTLHRKLFLFSSFYCEVWENQGIGYNLPFRRNNSLLMEYGTTTPGSVVVGFDMMGFQSNNRDGLGPVMMVSGTESIPISTKALDFQLAQYAATTGINDCRAFFMRENGLIFYRMNFTTSNHTFVYNVSMSNPAQEATRLWHEEEMLAGDRHVSQTHVFYNGRNYVGHYALPIFYIVDPSIYTNDGELIKRMRIGRPFVPPGYQRLRVDRFQLDLLQGQNEEFITSDEVLLIENGLLNILAENGNDLETDQEFETYQDIDPTVILYVSKDGGQTYGNALVAPMGDIGQRTFRTLWRKIGVTPRGQAFVPKIEFYNPLPFVILGASWSFEVLPE